MSRSLELTPKTNHNKSTPPTGCLVTFGFFLKAWRRWKRTLIRFLSSRVIFLFRSFIVLGSLMIPTCWEHCVDPSWISLLTSFNQMRTQESYIFCDVKTCEWILPFPDPASHPHQQAWGYSKGACSSAGHGWSAPSMWGCETWAWQIVGKWVSNNQQQGLYKMGIHKSNSTKWEDDVVVASPRYT